MRILLGLLIATTLAACSGASARTPAGPSDVELLQSAVHQVTNVMVYDILSPPQASRLYAYASVAAYETLRQGHPEYRSLAGQLNGLDSVPAPPAGETISLPLASVHAFMTVGRTLTFSRARADSLRAAMDERFRARGMSEREFARSVAYGDSVAQHVLRWSAKDRFLETRGAPKFSLTAAPGRWVPTPPAYMDAVEPSWGTLRPFIMDSASQFRPAPPLPFDTATSSRYMAEVREVYQVKRDLTDEQRALTAFWDCNPYVMHVQGHTMFATKKVTPGGHWMGIVGIAARQSNADMMKTTEAYARTSLALADAFISSWEEKFRSGMIRPETVIDKYVDETWEPLLQTPPFPEYTSGHSVISNAAAVVLTDEFGPNFSFLDSTETEFGLPPRTFASFEAAANEAAISRLYGGIHYRSSVEEGSREGRRIGEYALARVHTRGGMVARAVPDAAPNAAPGATALHASVPASVAAVR
jgi:hypothetical protein